MKAWLSRPGSPLSVALILFGLWVVWGYRNSELYYDEAYTIHEYVNRGWLRITTEYDEPNNHVLFNILTYLWFKVAGITSVIENTNVMRILPGTITVVTLLSLYKLTAITLGRNAARLSLILLTGCIPYYSYALRMRGYTLGCALFILFLLVLAYLEKTKARNRQDHGASLLLILLCALQVYNLPSSAAIVLPAGLAAIARSAVQRRWIYIPIFGLAAFLSLLFYFPMISDLSRVYLPGGSYGSTDSRSEFWFDVLPAVLTDLPGGALLTAFLFLPLLRAFQHPGRWRSGIVLIAAAGCSGFAGIIGLSGLAAPVRNFVIIMPGLAFLAAAGLHTVTAGRFRSRSGQTRLLWIVLLGVQLHLFAGVVRPLFQWSEKMSGSEGVEAVLHPLPYYFALDSGKLLREYSGRTDTNLLIVHEGDAYNLATMAIGHGLPVSMKFNEDFEPALQRDGHVFLVTRRPADLRARLLSCGYSAELVSSPALHGIFKVRPIGSTSPPTPGCMQTN
ncbi:MAG: hypothetical protein HS115_12605 [Spirochaetales bacterium]|nr:hypothetical protein [Spirochaetales bacterium]